MLTRAPQFDAKERGESIPSFNRTRDWRSSSYRAFIGARRLALR